MLNPQQQKVVEHGDGPLLVLAGAGSGKTRAIVHRIARVVREEGVHLDDILAVTFTNKAAGEMAERVGELLGPDSPTPRWISTFHSACARFLRVDAPRLGLPRSFTIFDQDDQKKMLAQVAKDLNLPSDRTAVASYQGFVERARNQGWLPEQAHEAGFGGHHEQRAAVYAAYHRRMRNNGTLDFGDLLLAMVELLESDDEVRERYQMRWDHILVDEFQDTNPVQYRLLQLMAKPPYNVTVVGDDDQCIYTWRGATAANLLGFENDFPGAELIRLEQNYRSTQSILDLANHVIAYNLARKEKVLWTDNGPGRKPLRFTGRDERSEASWVARCIQGLTRDGELTLGDVALFYRVNAQSRIYEEILRAYGIPYRVLAGISFYDREEVKDLLAYLRAAVNPNDEVAVARIANTPRRGLGDKTVGRARARARSLNGTLLQGLESLVHDPDVRISSRAKKGVQKFGEIMAELSAAATDQLPSDITNWLLGAIGYIDYMADRHPDNADDRLENIGELISAMRAYEDEQRAVADAESPTLAGFLERTALVSPSDDEAADQAVNLMTIHTSKGLEFPVVFLTGLEDGLIPLYRRGESNPEDEEEERRLFYVAVTRAKQRLFLTNAVTRRLYGNPSQRDASRFLDTLTDELAETDGESFAIPRSRQQLRAAVGARSHHPAYEDIDQRNPWDSRVVVDVDVPPDGLRMTRPSRTDDDLAHFVGKTARHKTFGAGRVKDAEYSGPRVKLTIEFPGHGVKKVIAQFVEIV